MPESTEDSQIPNRLQVSDEFGYWFSGFFDGEGCFIFRNKIKDRILMEPKIQFTQRADEEKIVNYVRDNLKCGNIFRNEYRAAAHKHQGTKPWVNFRVGKIGDLAEIIVPLFQKYPLHTKKAEEFSFWKLLVEARYRRKGKHPSVTEMQFHAEVDKWIRERRHL